MEESKTKLHFTRVRVKGEPDFYDVQTDIRRLLPAVSKLVVMELEDCCTDPELQKQFRYIHNCICIYQIRTVEDPQPIEHQIDAFMKAIDKVAGKAVSMWFTTMGKYMFMLYGLFCRRDSAADHDSLRAMMEYSRLAAYKDVLSPETYSKMTAELAYNGVTKPCSNVVTDNDAVVCNEEPVRALYNCKQAVRMFMFATGPKTWEDIAAACDESFSTEDGKITDDMRIRLGLAYPDYEHPTLSLEVEDDIP